MNKGALVLYKERPAVIKEMSLDKFEIELERGCKKVRQKDIVFFHEGPISSVSEALNAPLPDESILNDAKDLFEGETPLLSDIADLLFSSYSAVQLWTLWQLIKNSPACETTTHENPIRFRTDDEIEAFKAKALEKNALEANKTQCIQAIKAMKGGHSFIMHDCYVPFFQEIEAFALGTSEHSKMLSLAHMKENQMQAHTLLLNTGFWTIDKNPHPLRNGFSLHSSRAEIGEAQFGSPELDLSEETAYAIDAEWSTDPDDAVHFDGTYLWVHIASPADTIVPDSPAEIDARNRGATLYLPEGAMRMLEAKAIPFFALGQSDISHALSFRIALTDDGEIEEAKVFRTKIHVKCISYIQADKERDSADLKPLFDIADRNYIRRHKAGAVSIDMPEAHIDLFEEDGRTKANIEETAPTESSAMIKEMMLLAGEAAAMIAFKEQIPFPFITQERPEMPKKIPEGLAGEYKKRSGMRPRSIGTTIGIHGGLGLSMYSQVTSPLRRYSDLIAHQQLLAFLDGKDVLSADQVLVRVSAAEMALQNNKKAERASRKHWTLIFLHDNPDIQLDAIVLDIKGAKAHVCIPQLAMETDIKIKGDFELNQKIKLKVKSLDIPSLDVKFAVVD